MSRRLAFQTQLASIMEVLANAAVAEICKLVDDDYAVVSFQMSQCQRENKALKRKLHLLELKLARGTAERRHRDLTGNHPGNSSRAAGLRAAAEPLQEPLPPAGDVFVQHMEEALWSSRSIGEEAAVPILSDNIQPLSPDVELVKEEKMEANMVPDADPEEGLRLIGDDGVLECSPAGAGAASQKCDLEQKDCQSHSKSQIQSSPTKPVNSRGVEVSGSSPPLVCEPGAQHSDMLQEAGNPPRDMGDCDSHFDLCQDKSTNSLVEEIFDGTSHLEGPSPSCSYSLAAADFPSTSSSVNGRTRPDPLFPLPPDFSDNANALLRTGKERVFACSYCGKLFNRPKKVEIHQRTHTGEKPFRCSVCGKMFSEAGNLKKHQRVHTGQKPYTCGMCGQGFAWIRNLKMHYMKSHPDVYTEGGPSVQK